MTQCQLDAYAVLVRELPALVEELKKANKLKALELRLKTQYEWRPPTFVEDMNKLTDIMKRLNDVGRHSCRKMRKVRIIKGKQVVNLPR